MPKCCRRTSCKHGLPTSKCHVGNVLGLEICGDFKNAYLMSGWQKKKAKTAKNGQFKSPEQWAIQSVARNSSILFIIEGDYRDGYNSKV